MKKIVFFVFSLLLSISAFSYTWNNISPEGVIPKKLIIIDSDDIFVGIIARVDSGMFFADNLWNPVWEFYPAIVSDACSFDDNNILVLIREGSYSDGIYKFDLTSKEFTLVYNLYKPNFIKKKKGSPDFLVGFENGLMKSEDGINWTTIPDFEGLDCSKAAQGFGNNTSSIAVVTIEYSPNAYVSEDFGLEWSKIDSSPMITDAIFDWNGQLFGLHGSEGSYSQGYYKFTGSQWQNVFYSDAAILGCDSQGQPFFGWNFPNSQSEGIARYKNGEFLFLNEGLEDLHIRHITTLYGGVGGGVVFICTDSGAYYSSDYTTGISTTETEGKSILAYPNPTTSYTTIKLPENIMASEIKIYSHKGELLQTLEGTIKQEKIRIDMSDWESGVYYVTISDRDKYWTKQLIRL